MSALIEVKIKTAKNKTALNGKFAAIDVSQIEAVSTERTKNYEVQSGDFIYKQGRQITATSQDAKTYQVMNIYEGDVRLYMLSGEEYVLENDMFRYLVSNARLHLANFTLHERR